MGLGKKKAGRKEPLFGLPAALADLRLTAADRIPNAEDKPKKSAKPSAKRKPEEPDEEPKREGKTQPSRSGAKRRSKSRPEMGITKSKTTVYNQHDEVVLTMIANGLMSVRDPSAPIED